MGFDNFAGRVPGKGKVTREPHTKCAHCARKMNDFAGGSARGPNNELLCNPPHNNGRPDCFDLVMNYDHTVPCSHKECYSDFDDQRVYTQLSAMPDLTVKYPTG